MSKEKTAELNFDLLKEYDEITKIISSMTVFYSFKYDYNSAYKVMKKVTKCAEKFAQEAIKTVDEIKRSLEVAENQHKRLENCIANPGSSLKYVEKDLLMFVNTYKIDIEENSKCLVQSQKQADKFIQWAAKEKDTLEKFSKKYPVDINIL